MLTVVQVAFPFAPVGPDAVGGAEQILYRLDAGLTALGHRSIVVAAAGSATAGELVGTAVPAGTIDDALRRTVHRAHAEGIGRALRRGADLLHLHGIDFPAYLPPAGIPALVTLHLPPSWYAAEALRPTRPDTWLNPVSHAQHRDCPPSAALLPPIGNGVPVDALPAAVSRRGYALVLGRICPEKNQHAALDAGTRAGVPVMLGGAVFPYPEHERYWREAIQPRLANSPHRFLGPVGFGRKRRLLSGARCLVSASIAPETSSLVAMEALACGTPVVAMRSGALPEIVADGVTGFLVDDVATMATAIGAAPTIDHATCRATALHRFDARDMVASYIRLYERLSHTTRHARFA